MCMSIMALEEKRFTAENAKIAEKDRKSSPSFPPSVSAIFAISVVNLFLSLLEQGHAGCESVNEILSAHRPQFSLGEEPGQRDRSRFLADGRRVVVWPGEHARAASVATEHQRPGRP